MTSYSKLVRASALYDLILTSAFAIPLVAAIKLNLLQSLHLYLNLPGHFPDFEPLHLLFVNMLGSVVIVWSVLRWVRPEPVYGAYDSACRFLFSTAMAWALFTQQGPGLLWFFLVPELGWGVLQAVGYYQLRRSVLA